MEFYDSIRFLMYSYYSIDIKDSDKNEVISGAVRAAYSDATRHLLSLKGDENTKERYRNEAEECVKDNIIELIETDNCEFEQKFFDLCKAVVEVFWQGRTPNKDKEYFEQVFNRANKGKGELLYFTEGMAQKLVNMTIKNLCVIYHVFIHIGRNIDLPKQLQEKEKMFFAPVDSITMEAVWNYNNEYNQQQNTIYLPLRDTEKDKEKHGVFNTYKVIPWSKWKVYSENTPSEYQRFQDGLKNNLPKEYSSRIEWENDMWIKTSMKKKRKADKNK